MQATATTPSPENQTVILTSRTKVLHIISGDLWAGAETQALTLITALHSQCDVMVALMNHGELEKRLKQAGISTTVIDEQHFSSFNITRRLVSTIEQFQPDIIHTHRQKENILGSFANLIANKSLTHRKASVRTTHGAPEHKATGLKKGIIWLDNFCGKYLQDAIISVSQDLHLYLKKIFPAEKIHIIQNGVDLDALCKAKPAEDISAHSSAQFHIGIIGRLEPVKRVDLFLRAAQLLIAQHSSISFRFHVIGDGRLKEELIALARELEITSQVIFHGHRSDSINAIAAMNLVIMCSDHEGTPMTALEALALGKPLIAHNVGGLSEILSEYPRLLVDEHTPEGYSAKISDVLQHPFSALLNKNYTSQQNAARTLALYQSLTNNRVE